MLYLGLSLKKLRVLIIKYSTKTPKLSGANVGFASTSEVLRDLLMVKDYNAQTWGEL